GGTNIQLRVYEGNAIGGPFTALGQFENGQSFDFTKQYLMVEAVLTSAGISYGTPSLDDVSIKVTQKEKLQIGENNDDLIFRKELPAVNATSGSLGVGSVDVRYTNKVMKEYDTVSDWQTGIVSSTGIDYLSDPGNVMLEAQIAQKVSAQNPGAARCYMDIESATARPDGLYDVQMSVNMYGYDPDGAGAGNNADGLRWLGTFSVSDGNGAVTFDEAWTLDNDGATPAAVPLSVNSSTLNDGTKADATILDNSGAVSAGAFSTITFDYGTGGAKDGFGVRFTCRPDAVLNLTWNNDGLYDPAGPANSRTPTGDDYVSSDIYLGTDLIADNVGAGAGAYSVSRRLAEYTPLAAPTGQFETGPVYFGPNSDGTLSGSGVTNGGNFLFTVEESMDGIGGWSTILAPGAGTSFTTSANGYYVRLRTVMNGTPAAWSPLPYGYSQSTTPVIDRLAIEKNVSPIQEFTDAISSLNDIRLELGIIERELTSALETMTNQKLNYIESNSRIVDADLAAEMTDLTKNNIMLQGTMKIISQGDSIANGVVNLFEEQGIGGALKTPSELVPEKE
ncbi:MAG TPA: flagellin, partial [bacterium]|nr:flagellin [bacterium]